MASNTFQLSIVTPEKVALEREVSFVALPAHDGELGILQHRAPLLVRLDVGVLRLESAEGNLSLYIDGGFAQMVENRLTVLTEDAKLSDDLDRDAAQAALAQAKEMPSRDELDHQNRERAVKRAQTQIKLSGS